MECYNPYWVVEIYHLQQMLQTQALPGFFDFANVHKGSTQKSSPNKSLLPFIRSGQFLLQKKWVQYQEF